MNYCSRPLQKQYNKVWLLVRKYKEMMGELRLLILQHCCKIAKQGSQCNLFSHFFQIELCNYVTSKELCLRLVVQLRFIRRVICQKKTKTPKKCCENTVLLQSALAISLNNSVLYLFFK